MNQAKSNKKLSFKKQTQKEKSISLHVSSDLAQSSNMSCINQEQFKSTRIHKR